MVTMLGGLIYHSPPQHAQAPVHWLVSQPSFTFFFNSSWTVHVLRLTCDSKARPLQINLTLCKKFKTLFINKNLTFCFVAGVKVNFKGLSELCFPIST